MSLEFYPPLPVPPSREEMVEHPAHYGGPGAVHEVIECLEAWQLDGNAYRFQAIVYLARADRKGEKVADLRKAIFYINRELQRLGAQG